MEMKIETIKVLLIEDDEDDYILTRELLSEVKGGNYALDWASSYEEGLKVAGLLEHQVCLVDYRLGERSGVQLIREARESGLTTPMILLDLNMPKKDGREALREIKSDPELRQISVVVLTTSKAEEDIYSSYDSGASSFISKPVTFEGLVDVMKGLGRYWFEIVDLPQQHDLRKWK
jgi:CheY-like chemotaxis protein